MLVRILTYNNCTSSQQLSRRSTVLAATVHWRGRSERRFAGFPEKGKEFFNILANYCAPDRVCENSHYHHVRLETQTFHCLKNFLSLPDGSAAQASTFVAYIFRAPRLLIGRFGVPDNPSSDPAERGATLLFWRIARVGICNRPALIQLIPTPC